MPIHGIIMEDRFLLVIRPNEPPADLRLQKNCKNILYYHKEELIQVAIDLGLNLDPQLFKKGLGEKIRQRLIELNQILLPPLGPPNEPRVML
jgi:hypothetical protein